MLISNRQTPLLRRVEKWQYLPHSGILQNSRQNVRALCFYRKKEQLNELLLPENQSMWNGVLCELGGQGDLVAVALSQVSYIGGEIYWRRYGFETRLDWCAIFVSWCANECGYLENDALPSFAVCYVSEN